jgi:hypothetical protein
MPSSSTHEASPQQLRFAQERGATLGPRAAGPDRSVYVYLDEGWRTCRWLVDLDGEIVDLALMRRSAPAAPRFVRDGAPIAAASADAMPVWTA